MVVYLEFQSKITHSIQRITYFLHITEALKPLIREYYKEYFTEAEFLEKMKEVQVDYQTGAETYF